MVQGNLEKVSAKQVVLEDKIENANEGINSIVSHLANASTSNLDNDAKEAVNKLMTTVCSSSGTTPPNQSGTLNLSSEEIKVICVQVTELLDDLKCFRAELNSMNE